MCQRSDVDRTPSAVFRGGNHQPLTRELWQGARGDLTFLNRAIQMQRLVQPKRSGVIVARRRIVCSQTPSENEK